MNNYNSFTKYIGQSRMFKGYVSKKGNRKLYHGKISETVLLENIVDLESGTLFRDHLWFELVPEFKKMNLVVEDMITFEATITTYMKGYMGKNSINKAYSLNYALEGIQHVSRV